ncbi:PVC-type heme-binding CxxCH protein [Novipirellula rosea]|uniref:ThuA domain-containing protein n=1 Tax=Novipirellula rosea TaxID=1031540 RepID=A0ABP8MZA9_9BACT
MKHSFSVSALLLLVIASIISGSASAADPLKVLFLGDQGHHQPKPRFDELAPVLKARGIEMTYSEDLAMLNPQSLGQYDAVALYANIDHIEKSQADALLQYVTQGGGFVPLHCATYCFRNDDRIVALMGAQFQRHGTGVFRTDIANAEHPLMQGFDGFESWDETYVHHMHNEKNRTVLEYRVDAEGREPWTWIRSEGEGRVFYTAWGHDSRTWTNPGFQNLVERGIRWAAKGDPQQAGDFLQDQAFPVPEMTKIAADVKPFEYQDVGSEIPNYTPSDKWGVQGKPMNMMQKPLEPAESMKHLVVPKGFHVELFASEPELKGKPICMAWDERGRLWVAETYDYPNELQPTGKGRDRIRICEDTDGDWKADKFTVFAEELSIPTSITFHDGGAIVQNATETLYLKDTDGDDKADVRKVLIKNWTLGDTHGGVSNFQYGLDNWIWAMQGYNQSKPVADGKPQQAFRMGFFRMRPDGSEVEFIRSTNNNTWGLGISEEGLIFGSTANGNPSVFMPIANRYYERVRGWTPSLTLSSIADSNDFHPITDKVRQVDHHGGYTAAAGHSLYTAREYPQEYWNRVAFVNGPTGHLTGAFVLKHDGSGFTSTSPFNLLASDDEWTAPIMAEIGPDGQVWIIDWYNYIVQHNPTPQGFETGKGAAYETKLRDKKHGRIYRVVFDGSDAKPSPDLSKATPSELVAALTHPTMLTRKHAQRLLVERGKTDVTEELIALIQDESTDAIGLNVGAIHALWTLKGLGELDADDTAASSAVFAALHHPSAGVRHNAVKVLPSSTASVDALLAAGVHRDPNANTKLAAILALSDLPASTASGEAVAQILSEPANLADRWIPDAATSAAAQNSIGFLQAVAKNQTSNPATKLLEITQRVAEHYARGDRAGEMETLTASLQNANPAVIDAVFAGISNGWQGDQKIEMTAELESNLESLLDQGSPGTRGVLVRLATQWGSKKFEKYSKEITDAFVETLSDEDTPDAKRIDAARKLVEFNPADEETVTSLLDQLNPRTPPALADGILDALEQSSSESLGPQLIDRLATMTPSVRLASLTLLLKRPGSTKSLLEAAKNGDASLNDLALDQKQSLASHPNKSIREEAKKLLESGGSLPNADRQKVLEELSFVAHTKGDAVKGKEVFKVHCGKCHVHSGEGSPVGPDLTGMAVHPKEELLTHILDPSRNVEGNFRVYTVLTLDGLVLNGMLASESKTAIELFDTEGKKHAVLREDIEELVASQKSIMPEGFEKSINPKELTDLLEFLTQRGKHVAMDLSKVMSAASDRGMFINPDGEIERLVFSDWAPKTFKGVPFQLIDPRNGSVPNVVVLNSNHSPIVSKMPKSVTLPLNGPAKAIHLLSGVSGWGFPYSDAKTVSMMVRIHYADGESEDHELLNGVHFADYIRRVDVPESEFAFDLSGRQIRYLAVYPKRAEPISTIELVKGPDRSAPVVMAMTVESP